MHKRYLGGLGAVAVFAAGLAWTIAAQAGGGSGAAGPTGQPGAPDMGSNDFFAPDPAPVVTENPVYIADAKAQAKAAGLACQVGAVRFGGEHKLKVSDQKSIKAYAYEVTCQGGYGYVVEGPEHGSADTVAMPCPALEQRDAGASTEGGRCVLPGNHNGPAQIQALATRYGAPCTVTGQKWRGLTKDRRDLFEVTCKGVSPGYVLSVPRGGEAGAADTCLKYQGELACTLTTPQQQLAWMSGLAAGSDRACRVTKARFVGAADQTQFYEMGCASGPGFMVETDRIGAYHRAIPCDSAGGIGGGCTLTDRSVLAASTTATLAERLKAAGVACEVAQARLVGREPTGHRDVVEYACADRPAGLVVAFASDSAKTEQLDCISAAQFAVTCQFTPRDKLLATLSRALAAAGRSCEVTNYAYLGSVEGGASDLEVACRGAPGHIVVMSADYARARSSESCEAAAHSSLACKLPENH